MVDKLINTNFKEFFICKELLSRALYILQVIRGEGVRNIYEHRDNLLPFRFGREAG